MEFQKLHHFTFVADPAISGELLVKPLAQTASQLGDYQLGFKQEPNGFFLYSPTPNSRLAAQPLLMFALYPESANWAANLTTVPARLGESVYFGSSLDQAVGAETIPLIEQPLLQTGFLSQEGAFALHSAQHNAAARPVTESIYGLDTALFPEDNYTKVPASEPVTRAASKPATRAASKPATSASALNALPNTFFLASLSLLATPPLAIVTFQLTPELPAAIDLEFTFT